MATNLFAAPTAQLVVSALLVLAACGGSSNHAASGTQNSPLPHDALASTAAVQQGLPESSLKAPVYATASPQAVTPPTTDVRVVVHDIQGYGDAEGFARTTAALLERVVNSTEFKKAVINGKYLSDNGQTPTQIYEAIRTAHEQTTAAGTNGVLDFRLRTLTPNDQLYDSCKWHGKPGALVRTVGVDGAGGGTTATCSEFIHDQQAGGLYSELAGHYMHEYMHMLGFSHQNLGNQRAESVPYQVGNMVVKLVTNYGQPLSGTVTPGQKFATLIDGTPRELTVYRTGEQVRKQEALDLTAYVGRQIRLRVATFSDTEAYGAAVIR